MKIFSAYKTTDKPWGGANNFLRTLKDTLSSRFGLEFVDSFGDADIAFFNQTSAGPGNGSAQYQARFIRKLKKNYPQVKLAVRAINLDKLVGRLPWWKYYFGVGYRKDRNSLALLKLADCVIFQSNFQKKLFQEVGVRLQKYKIIHNGAATAFKCDHTRPSLGERDDLIFMSSSFSGGKYKRHDLIAELSKIAGVKVYFVGTWPKGLNSENVIISGVLDHATIIDIMRRSHYLFHPSTYDICPNSVIESLYSGMPVLYNPDLETGAELAGEYGLPFDTNDLTKTVRQAREKYGDLVGKLSADFKKYGIERAAEEYFQVFRALKDKNG